MKIIRIIILILISKFSFGQDSIFYLHSWKHAKRIIEIEKGESLHLFLQKEDSIGKVHPISYRGNFVSAKRDKIVLDIRDEYFELKKENGEILNTSISYSFPDSSIMQIGEKRTIDINNINSLSRLKGRTNIGGPIIALAIVTAIFIAPLVSINYKTGNFNENIYYPMMAGCAVAVVVGIPLNRYANKSSDKIKIKNNTPDPCDMNYYRIQTNP